ncbi:hypothetical protein [Saccharopolyspora shandongensis]|uniref:hypothetical protein n=1 Tax=Saccharopolyspora shandongensis TaxID=418495 RepID=UPI0034118FAD
MTFTEADQQFLTSIGATTESTDERHPEWVVDDVLAAVVAGRVQVQDLTGTGVIRAWVRGLPATVDEITALADLAASDHVDLTGPVAQPTNAGRALHSRWSRYMPCHRSNRQEGSR